VLYWERGPRRWSRRTRDFYHSYFAAKKAAALQRRTGKTPVQWVEEHKSGCIESQLFPRLAGGSINFAEGRLEVAEQLCSYSPTLVTLAEGEAVMEYVSRNIGSALAFLVASAVFAWFGVFFAAKVMPPRGSYTSQHRLHAE
jgi:hypothetical protein